MEGVGHVIGERLVERVSRDTPRFKNELDAVIFICKIFWMHAFSKQVDNLKTNHQVMFWVQIWSVKQGLLTCKMFHCGCHIYIHR